MKIIKLFQKSFFLSLAVMFTYFCLLLETVKYPGFMGNHFYIDTKVYFAITIVLLLFLSTKSKVMDLIFKINRLLLISLFLIYLGFIIAEGAHYTNYVLATFHFHLDGLVLMVLFSFSIFLIGKFGGVVPKSIKGLGIVYPIMTLLIVFSMTKNMAFVTDMAANRDAYILFHLQSSYDEKMFYQWQDFYRFMVFVKNNTPSNANIVIPPQQDPWLIGTGNPRFVRSFLYPRNIIQGTKIIPDMKVFGPNTFVLISWGKEECKPAGCHGWPRQDIKAKKIIYKDPNDYGVIEIKEKTIYRLEDEKYVYGVIEL